MKKENTKNITQSILSPLERARVRLKVCGMKYQDNIEQVAALQPDYLGFIFYEKSSRFFNADIPKFSDTIKKVGVFVDASVEDILTQIEKHNLQVVQLHGDESPEFCEKLKHLCHSALDAESIMNKSNVKKIPLTMSEVEESQDEIPQSLHSFRNDKNEKSVISSVSHRACRCGIEIIKVFSIKNQFDFTILKPYEQVVDYFLFDTKGDLPGGNGYTFDWNVLKNYPSTKPYFLSGGIGLVELKRLKEFQKSPASKYCYAIDVNSKFETEPGMKNIELLNKFKSDLSFRA